MRPCVEAVRLGAGSPGPPKGLLAAWSRRSVIDSQMCVCYNVAATRFRVPGSFIEA